MRSIYSLIHFSKLIVYIQFALWSILLKGQASFINKDTTYLPTIATVGFHPIGNPLGYPLIKLNQGRLLLFFDDHRGGFTDLKYKVVHCDSKWNPSDITIAEYVSGFEKNG
jgi:hypothetical protein